MALFIPTILTQGIYAGIIGTISSVTINSCGLVKSVCTHKNPNVCKIIKEIDIERRLHLIQAVINTIDDDFNSTSNTTPIKLDDMEKTQIFELIGSNTNLLNDPIELCLIYLHEIIQEINNDLVAINAKVQYHNTKWFCSWRKLNVAPMLENLRINSTLLEDRFNDLTKISIFLNNKKNWN